MNLSQYIDNLNARFQTGISREHAYRGDLQQLLESLLPSVMATNEPARIDCGAPDYVLTRKDIPLGYIEAKDIGVDLTSKSLKEQFERYKAALDNLIFTDYLDFHFYKNGELVSKIAIAEIQNGRIAAKPDQFAQFTALIENFALQVTQSIKSPTKLAQMMAAKAKLMAQVVEKALDSDDASQANSELKGQLSAFKSILIHDIDNRAFADMYAQTLAYGLFAARYHDPTLATFSRFEAASLIPKSNPFLRKLFQHIAGPDLDSRLVWIVDELVHIFLAADVAKIMQGFGKSTRQDDPIIHFYETFLANYDAKLRKARGVWYTPEPVVNFIVRAVDDILKSHFNLPKGLADTSKTKIKRNVPDKKGKLVAIEEEVHRVQILDPATGTGTFLAQVIRHIHQKHFASLQGAWPDYVQKHLIPRLNGFELLMTSYAMAHLKLDMLLSETGYKIENSNERLQIYLTNSLEEHHPDTGTLFASWLSAEANEANHIKRDAPVMVVIGNPPYSGHSSNKGDWIESLLDAYKQEPGGGKLKEKNPKWLNDDYVKFIRYGQHYIDRNGEGVLAFITNHGYLDNPTFRGMRYSLMQSFDEIYVLDLHGNAKKKESSPDGGRDENVFDIMQGVSIAFMIKLKPSSKKLANIQRGDLYGLRENKYDLLSKKSFIDLTSNALMVNEPHYSWAIIDNTLLKEYEYGFGLKLLFINDNMGVTTGNDSELVQFHLNDFSDALDINLIKAYSYRPFDSRFIYYNAPDLARARAKFMKNLESSENIALCLIRRDRSENIALPFITRTLIDKCIVSTLDNANIFPLYIYPDAIKSNLLGATRTPNLHADIVQKISQVIGLPFVPEKQDGADTFAPIDILDYIYAVLHSPNYCEKYKEFLKIDFPRVPYPENQEQFWQLAALGAQLRQTHLLENPALAKAPSAYPINGDNVVAKPRYENGCVFINATQYFADVPESVWAFYIGGYQPAQKWLKDRRERTLSFEDIVHYQKIITALTETEHLMGSIAKII